jgi:peptidoglycan hydrolase FlgJ
MAMDPTHKLGLSIDPASLQALKSQSHNAPEASLKAAAKQFEGVFLNMMLKSMRDTVPQDGPGNSQQTKMFQGMLDEQYASALSQGRGLGLADMIVRQFKAKGWVAASGDDPSGSISTTSSSSVAALQSTITNASPLSIQEMTPASLPTTNKPLVKPISVPIAKNKEVSDLDSNLGSGLNMNNLTSNVASVVSSFKDKMAEFATSASQITGIPAHFLLAQAGLESGWGKHQPMNSNGSPSYNLFGIKAGPNWNGPVVKASTTEVVNGTPQKVVQTFRAYSSYAEAFHDYASLLSGSARYAKALATNTAQDFSNALQKAGYATDPAYSQKIRSAIKMMNATAV